MDPRKIFHASAFIVTSVIILFAQRWDFAWFLFFIFGPIILIGLSDIFQKSSTIKRNFPVVGHFRFLLESIRPEIMQYFIESDRDGRPFNRIQRSIIYQRSKKAIDTEPFGTQKDVYQVGYEWLDHSIYAVNHDEMEFKPRVIIGGKDCIKPYAASILNVSAMSFGSLSDKAVMALNKEPKWVVLLIILVKVV